MRFIFITGGVVSSVGKGIVSASIGVLLQSKGYKVRIRKMDPYLNIDPGTISPYEHGEVFVTEDGAEADLDLGHYERFTGVNCSAADSISAGQIFNKVIQEERKGNYLGQTVQIIPHITDEIKRRVELDLHEEDFVICEIGGTVGDIEATPFLEAIRQFANEKGRENVLFIHVTLLPYLKCSGELKTKPTQHSIKELQRAGISPNILLCRSEVDISEKEIKKLALFCNVNKENVIPALDCNNLHQVVINYYNAGLKTSLFNYFFPHLKNSKFSDSVNKNDSTTNKLQLWEKLVEKEYNLTKSINLYVVAKYLKSKDAYISLEAALRHSGIENSVQINLNWVDAEKLEKEVDLNNIFKNCHGILVPGGYGYRGTVGKIKALEYGRIHNIPTLGICLGAQLMVIEILLNVAKLSNVGSSEFGNYSHNAISLLTEWIKEGVTHTRTLEDALGGSMRLGAFPCNILPNTLAYQIYQQLSISERHRHRYEININYKEQLQQNGLIISGVSPDGLLPEIIELKNHNFFLGVQFHPEFKSRLFAPHLLFNAFIKAQIDYKNYLNNNNI